MDGPEIIFTFLTLLMFAVLVGLFITYPAITAAGMICGFAIAGAFELIAWAIKANSR